MARAAPPAVEVVDGTAAGDAFTACLLVSLLEGRDLDEALTRACAAGGARGFAARRSAVAADGSEIDEIIATLEASSSSATSRFGATMR